MKLEEKKIMPPPWLVYPEIERYSIGWRMGYGENYIYKFWNWLDTLTSDELAEYRSLFRRGGGMTKIAAKCWSTVTFG